MKRNPTIIGSGTLSGDYGRVLATGELVMDESSADSVSVAGSLVLTKCEIAKANVAGELDATNSRFKRIKCAGALECKGECTCEFASVSGALEADTLTLTTLTQSEHVKVDGCDCCEWISHTLVKAETIDLFAPTYLNGVFRADSVISRSDLRCGELECTEFTSCAKLTADSVNAERISVLPCAGTKVGSLMGTRISVKRDEALAKKLKAEMPDGFANIETIEADTVEIENTRAERVSGIDVKIGAGCEIGLVEYTGTLVVADGSTVREQRKG